MKVGYCDALLDRPPLPPDTNSRTFLASPLSQGDWALPGDPSGPYNLMRRWPKACFHAMLPRIGSFFQAATLANAGQHFLNMTSTT